MIGGYFAIDRAFKAERAVKLWKQVAFYSVGIFLLCAIFGSIAPVDVVKAVLPISSKTYWLSLIHIWTPFQTFWDNAYELDTTGSLETLYSCIDRQNFIDFDLYYNVIAGMDNRFKNIIYSTVMNKDGTYVIRRIPWDQNYSWGDDFEQGEDKDIKNIRFNPELKTKWLNEDVFRNMQALDDTLPAEMLRTWKRWRESFLTEERWKDVYKRQVLSRTAVILSCLR